MRNIEQLETPCYILDVNRLDKNAEALLNGFGDVWHGAVIPSYSVKTNSLPWIITHLRKKGFFAEVVSEQEYKLVKHLGFSDREIILNGPVKTETLLLDALNGGAFVNLDNSRELEYIEKNVHKAKDVWKIGLRYNFFLEKECPGETIVGNRYSRFGFCVENGDFKRAVERVRKCPNVEIAGLHGHNSTKSKSLNIYRAIAKKAFWLIKEYDLKLDYLDIGGGFFGDMPGKPDFIEYARAIMEDAGTESDLTLIIEPGASIIASPISYLCEVDSVKEVNSARFVTTNGSRIHIDPHMHGINFRTEVYYNSLVERDKDSVNQELCGFTCIELDRMGMLTDYPALQIGDRIRFMNCGSYSMSLSPLFISYFPIVYAQDNNGFRVVRQAWDELDFVRKSEMD